MVLLFSLTAAHSADEDSLSLFVAGDMIVMRPLSNTDDPRFLQLVHEIRNADVAAVNLETLFHEFKGYPQANSGGTYMATSPEIAKDLAWAGIDMVGNANNHTYDYGSIGVLENLQNLAKARVLVAGVGEDLQQARAPKYFHHSRGTVALISAASSFVHYGKASRSRPDLHGRPGLNPLAIHSHIAVDIPSGAADFLGLVARLVGYSGSAFNHHRFRLLGVEVTRGRPFHLYIGTRPSPIDLKAILETIIQASRSADLIIVSIHAHRQGDWLRAFARQAIDAGADIFMAHGPHEILGIEIYRNRPIFYCLGDFFYEQHHIERLPVEYYERYQLGDDASVQDAIKARYATEGDRREAWEGLGAIVEFRNDVMRTIRLIPLDLGFGKPLPMRGRPLVALPALGRSIIDVVKTKSAQYGTEVVYIPEDNIGLIVNERPASEASSREGE
jgi:poly-gamma-glutamate capsule biosynthesis protein CapA/YwtB (metallophosphatase superfamily)